MQKIEFEIVVLDFIEILLNKTSASPHHRKDKVDSENHSLCFDFFRNLSEILSSDRIKASLTNDILSLTRNESRVEYLTAFTEHKKNFDLSGKNSLSNYGPRHITICEITSARRCETSFYLFQHSFEILVTSEFFSRNRKRLIPVPTKKKILLEPIIKRNLSYPSVRLGTLFVFFGGRRLNGIDFIDADFESLLVVFFLSLPASAFRKAFSPYFP